MLNVSEEQSATSLGEQIPQRLVLEALVLDPQDGHGHGEREYDAHEDPLRGGGGRSCLEDDSGGGYGHGHLVVVLVDGSAFSQIWQKDQKSTIQLHSYFLSRGQMRIWQNWPGT